MILFLLFKGVAPGGRSRAVRLELSLRPLKWKMLTHFGAAPSPCRPMEPSSVKQRFFCVLKSVYKIKFFIIRQSFHCVKDCHPS